MTLGTLEYVLEEGSRWNWFDDATIRDCAMIAGVAGFLFVVRSLTFARPVVDLRAFGNRNFTLGCILSFITGIGIFSTIYLTPLFLGYVRGFSAWQTGMAVFSTGMASLVGVPVYVMLAKRFDTRWLMMIGLASFGLSMWSFSFITHEWGAAELFLPQVLRGFPQVFAVAPSVNLGLGSLPPERLKYASGLFNMMRNLGGAVGIAVCGAILNNRTNFHFHAIASNLTPANGAMTRLVNEVASAMPRSRAASKRAIRRRSSSSGLSPIARRRHWPYADAFLAIMVCFIFATMLVPFLRNVGREGPGASRALKSQPAVIASPAGAWRSRGLQARYVHGLLRRCAPRNDGSANPAALTPSSARAPRSRPSARACRRARRRRGPSPRSRRRYRAPIRNIARRRGSPSRPCGADARARGRCP